MADLFGQHLLERLQNRGRVILARRAGADDERLHGDKFGLDVISERDLFAYHVDAPS